MHPRNKFDRVIAALGHKYRRRLLVALLAHNPQDDTDPQNAERALGTVKGKKTETELIETELVHNHLPKLEEMGYITWNQDTGDIAQGPNWEEIAPLLRLLEAHSDELTNDWL